MPLIDISDTYQMTNVGAHINATEVSATHPNLLDNWWFGTGVINQRAVTSGTEFANSKYRMDRWQTTWGTSQTGGTWELTSDGLTLTSTNGGVYFRQKLLNYAFLVGKRITASVMLADGTVYSASVIRSSGTQLFSHGLQGFSMGFEGSNAFRFGPSGTGYSFTVKAIKLELGGVSTLANDAPPNPAEELAKCQYYYQIVSLANLVNTASNATTILIRPRLWRSMREITNPTIAVITQGTARGTDGNHTITNVAITGTSTYWNLSITTSGLTTGSLYAINDTQISISADL